jgi:hypothetical protein
MLLGLDLFAAASVATAVARKRPPFTSRLYRRPDTRIELALPRARAVAVPTRLYSVQRRPVRLERVRGRQRLPRRTPRTGRSTVTRPIAASE